MLDFNSPYSIPCVEEVETTCSLHELVYKSRHLKRPDGSILASKCPQCDLNERSQSVLHYGCACQRDVRKNTVENFFKRAAIPPLFENSTLENYRVDIPAQAHVKEILVNYANNLPSNLQLPRHIILEGKTGTGKTHFSVGILQKAIKYGYSGMFITVSELITHIKSSGWEKEKAIASFKEPDLLVLDEVTDTLKDIDLLWDVITARYSYKRAMILLTNLDEPQLNKVLGDRIMDRLRQNGGVYLSLLWESYRGN